MYQKSPTHKAIPSGHADKYVSCQKIMIFLYVCPNLVIANTYNIVQIGALCFYCELQEGKLLIVSQRRRDWVVLLNGR